MKLKTFFAGLFAMLSILCFGFMCAVVAWNYCYLLNRFDGSSANPAAALYYIFPFSILVLFFALAAFFCGRTPRKREKADGQANPSNERQSSAQN